MNNYYTMETTEQNQGNNYSSWQPSSKNNNDILVNTNINSNWNYRQYVQKNANQIMKNNTMQSISDTGINPYSILNTETLDTSPFIYKSIHDTSSPIYKSPVNSDLKRDYLIKEQMKARMVAPSIPTNF